MYYLGERYKMEKGKLNQIEILIQDHIITFNQDQAIDHKTIDQFLRSQALKVFNERLCVMYKYFIPYNVKKPTLKIRKMKSRYGTCYYNDQKIILNLSLIQCKISHIDYVIAHELCHFLYPDHGKGFKALLSAVVPDWRDKKIELNKLFGRLPS
nr:SprT-like domain-containing protein [Haloplasma contractile]